MVSDTLKLERESKFELLRIVSMIAIIVCHLAENNNYLLADSVFTISDFIHSFFSCCGQLGVILFVLITGYFMINSKIKLKKF